MRQPISLCPKSKYFIQYLDANAQVHEKNITLLEMKDGTAQTIADALLHYLTDEAHVTLDLVQIVGEASDGASVIVGPL